MNIINSAVIVESSAELQQKSLPHYFLDNVAECAVPEAGATMMSLQEVQLQHIRRVLRFTDGNRTQAAKILGISRVSLINKIKQFGL